MKLLIVEDDRMLNNGIKLSLKEEKTKILQAFCISEAREMLNEKIDLIILDVNLPDGSGFEFCQELRKTSNVPVIFLTANDMEIDIVTGLEMGADDYITKPFSLMVLRARVNAILRRNMPSKNIFEQTEFYFNFDEMTFLVDGNSVELSKTEQKLLKLLISNCGNTISRDILIDRIWSDGSEFVDENALSVTIKRLREKLVKAPIKTVYGIGYMWSK